MNRLPSSIDKLCTTKLGVMRIKRTLENNYEKAVRYCKKILDIVAKYQNNNKTKVDNILSTFYFIQYITKFNADKERT